MPNRPLIAKDVHSGYSIEPKDLGVSSGMKINGVCVPFNIKELELYGTYFWALNVGFSHKQAMSLGSADNLVDSMFSPFQREFQAWHFNTFANTSIALDSRTLLGILKIFEAYQCFIEARAQKRDAFVFKTVVQAGLAALGTALHPLQDYYAHTPDMVKYYPAFKMWGHVEHPWLADDPIQRWGQLIKTKEVTIQVLSVFYWEFQDVFSDYRVR